MIKFLKISSRLLAEAAVARGWNVEYYDPEYTSLVLITPPGREGKLFKSSVTQQESLVGSYVARNKYVTYLVLEKNQYPVPKTWLANKSTFSPVSGKKYVVKPATANHGDGVFVNLEGKQAISRAIQQAGEYANNEGVVIQEQLQGEDYRFTVVGEEVYVIRRRPPIVTGDGHSTIAQLVEELNSQPNRGVNGENILNRVSIEDVTAFLGSSRTQTVLADGERLALLGTANAGRGGSTENVTQNVHGSLKELAREVTRLLAVDVCGVDIMCEDIKRPIYEQEGGIIEINLSPGIKMHHRPSIGTPVNVAGKILDVAFKE